MSNRDHDELISILKDHGYGPVLTEKELKEVLAESDQEPPSLQEWAKGMAKSIEGAPGKDR